MFKYALKIYKIILRGNIFMGKAYFEKETEGVQETQKDLR